MSDADDLAKEIKLPEAHDRQPYVFMPSQCKLVNDGGTWVLYHQGKEYLRLLDAKSRKDAQSQIEDMMLLRIFEVSQPDKPPNM